MIDGDVLVLFEGEPVETLADVEESFARGVEREVRPDVLVVEVVFLLA